MSNKTRLDVLLVERGLEQTRQRAQAMIMSGLVFVDGQRVRRTVEIGVSTEWLTQITAGLEEGAVVYVADCRDFLCGGADRHDAMLIDKEKSLIVINKIDIDPGGAAEAAERFFQGFLCLKTSLLHRDGADMIFELIRERCLGGNVNFGSENIITNERHKQLIDSAIKLLQNSRESYSAGMPLDCVSYDVRLCTEMLGGIIGRNISDDVIHDIFSRFCLGK